MCNLQARFDEPRWITTFPNIYIKIPFPRRRPVIPKTLLCNRSRNIPGCLFPHRNPLKAVEPLQTGWGQSASDGTNSHRGDVIERPVCASTAGGRCQGSLADASLTQHQRGRHRGSARTHTHNTATCWQCVHAVWFKKMHKVGTMQLEELFITWICYSFH